MYFLESVSKTFQHYIFISATRGSAARSSIAIGSTNRANPMAAAAAITSATSTTYNQYHPLHNTLDVSVFR